MMEGDNILHYAEMVRAGFTKPGILARLPEAGWYRAKDGKMPASKSSRRAAAVIFERDLAQFHFANGSLQAVTVECRPFAGGASQTTGSGWKELRSRVSEHLGQPGQGKWVPSTGNDWRCQWGRGPVLIEALSTVEARRRKLRLTMQIPRVGPGSEERSLEDLFEA
jgi:hypothetical protein